MGDIDVVYLWCGLPENDRCSFTKDIYYSIRSVKKYLPFIRKIWIIVNDDTSDAHIKKTGLNLYDGQIRLVHNTEFIPKQYLPIHWNSNVVESWIWKIKGLSEKFIYFCDDMYVGKPCTPEMFFHNDDIPVLRVHRGVPNHTPSSQNTNDYVNMWLNAITKHNIHYTRHAHNCQPYKRSLLKRFYNKYKKEVNDASQNKTRNGKQDFNLLRFTGSLSVMYGESVLIATDPKTQDYFVESNDKRRIRKILDVKPQFFCINNTHMDQTWVYDMLDNYFK
jgi:hypothetical protein